MSEANDLECSIRKIANLVSAVEGSDDAPVILISRLSARSLERDRLKGEIARLAARQAMAAEDVQSRSTMSAALPQLWRARRTTKG